MKALVTGGSGFIGSTLIEALTRRGISVRVLMRKTSSDKNLAGLEYERVEGDIGNPESLLPAVSGVDIVFHLAGSISAVNRTEYFRSNSESTGALARAVETANANGSRISRFVYVSSLAAGGPSLSGKPRNEKETDAPISAYGESKRGGELELLAHSKSFLPLILRPPMVYGPKDQATLVLIKTVAKRVIPRFATATPDGEKYYSVIHSRDLVEAIIALGTVEAARVEHGDRFYISSGEEISASRLMKSMADALGVKTVNLKIPLVVLKGAAFLSELSGKILGKATLLNSDKVNEITADYWTCSNLKLMTKTTWRPRTTLEEGVRDAVKWYQKNGWIK